MTAAQGTDVRSMYPHDADRVPRSLGPRTVLAAVAVAAAIPALLVAVTRPLLAVPLVSALVVLAVDARSVAVRLRGVRRVRTALPVERPTWLRRDGSG